MNIDQTFQNIWNSIVSFVMLPWDIYLTVIRNVFVILDVLLLIVLIFLVIKARAFAPKLSLIYRRPSLSGLLKKKGVSEKYKALWERIVVDSEANPPHSYTTAIVNADILIDEMLKDAGFEGKDMGERLGKLNGLGIKSLNSVWRVHRLRNKLVHTSGFEASKEAKDDSLRVYETFLREIKIID